MRAIYNDEAFIRAMVAEGRAEAIIRDALKSGCVAGLPGASAFVCPVCGSGLWRTVPADRPTVTKSIDEGYGSCSGSTDDGPCMFVWNRGEDAWVFWPSPPKEC